ncbi:MAG: hypothetical protein KJ600_02225 [Nanoarchaeota archaeon]|nr:hypothetical protein [Nanoarchaeota archaeon]MBU1103351.1 hypothetical protein [Nanoarchaeota archaeon]
MNKRGQDLSIGTLILIVLGIVVLVLLILGFSLGWSNLWEKINIFGGTSIGTVATQCEIDVTQGNTYDFCQSFKKVKVDGKTEYLNCKDGRIDSTLDTKLNCPAAPGGASSLEVWYCNELKNKETDKTKFDDQIKVNSKTCELHGVKKDTASPATTVP